jgi:hypothetical protein
MVKLQRHESFLWAAGLFLLACGTRILIAVFIPFPEWNGEMLLVIKSLLQTGVLADPYGVSTGPTAHITPVYPVLMAILIRLFGSNTFFSFKVLAILSSGFVAALMPVISARSGLGRRTGIIAALIFAAAPVFQTEILGTWEQPLSQLCIIFLMLISIEASDHSWTRGSDTFRYGMLAGFSILLSPSLLFVIALTLLQLILTREYPIGRRTIRFCQISVIILLWLTPWTIRNYIVMGGFVPLRSNFGLELYIGNNPDSDGSGFAKSAVSHPHPLFNPTEKLKVQKMGELNYMKEKQRLALDWIAHNPVGFFRLTIRRFFFFWFPTGDLCIQSNPILGKIFSAFLCAISVLAFFALGKKWILKDRLAWLWTVFLIAPTLIYIITHFIYRYRTPIHAISLLLACEAVISFLSPCKHEEYTV